MSVPQPFDPSHPYPPAQHPAIVPQQQAPNGVAVGGMVTGIVGLVFVWIPILGIILGAIATILSGVGLHNANSKNASGRGMAVAGLVCGILAVIFGIIWIAIINAAEQAAPFWF